MLKQQQRKEFKTYFIEGFSLFIKQLYGIV